MDSKSLNELTLRDKLSKWFQSPLGKIVYAQELQQLEEILPKLFGYHIVQCGYYAELDYLKSSRVANKTILFLEDTEIQNEIDADRP